MKVAEIKDLSADELNARITDTLVAGARQSLAGNGITAAATKLGRGAKIAFSRTVRRSTPRTAT